MSETKFTKGPWLHEPKHEDFGRGRDIGIRGRGEHVSGFVAFVNTAWPHQEQRAEQEANAHLIAAAPELYEALEEALADIRCYYGTTYLNQHAKAEAALAKARGESK